MPAAQACLGPPVWRPVPLACHCSPQLGVSSKFSEGALDPAGDATDEDTEESQPQHGPL